jgi:hypothetical protein
LREEHFYTLGPAESSKASGAKLFGIAERVYFTGDVYNIILPASAGCSSASATWSSFFQIITAFEGHKFINYWELRLSKYTVP